MSKFKIFRVTGISLTNPAQGVAEAAETVQTRYLVPGSGVICTSSIGLTGIQGPESLTTSLNKESRITRSDKRQSLTLKYW